MAIAGRLRMAGLVGHGGGSGRSTERQTLASCGQIIEARQKAHVLSCNLPDALHDRANPSSLASLIYETQRTTKANGWRCFVIRYARTTI
jgi:hypothetical protein